MSTIKNLKLYWSFLLVLPLILSCNVCFGDAAGDLEKASGQKIQRYSTRSSGNYSRYTPPQKKTVVYRQQQHTSQPAPPQAAPVFVPDQGSVMGLGIIGAGLQNALSPKNTSSRQQQEAAAVEAERKQQLESKRQNVREFLYDLDSPVVDFKKNNPSRDSLKSSAVPKLGEENQESAQSFTVPDLPLPYKSYSTSQQHNSGAGVLEQIEKVSEEVQDDLKKKLEGIKKNLQKKLDSKRNAAVLAERG